MMKEDLETKTRNDVDFTEAGEGNNEDDDEGNENALFTSHP